MSRNHSLNGKSFIRRGENWSKFHMKHKGNIPQLVYFSINNRQITSSIVQSNHNYRPRIDPVTTSQVITIQFHLIPSSNYYSKNGPLQDSSRPMDDCDNVPITAPAIVCIIIIAVVFREKSALIPRRVNRIRRKPIRNDYAICRS